RDDPELARRELGRVGGRPEAADDLARAREDEAPRIDRVDVLACEVVAPDLDVVELCQVRREERPDRPAADDAHVHEYDASLPRASGRTGEGRGPAGFGEL